MSCRVVAIGLRLMAVTDAASKTSVPASHERSFVRRPFGHVSDALTGPAAVIRHDGSRIKRTGPERIDRSFVDRIRPSRGAVARHHPDGT